MKNVSVSLNADDTAQSNQEPTTLIAHDARFSIITLEMHIMLTLNVIF